MKESHTITNPKNIEQITFNGEAIEKANEFYYKFDLILKNRLHTLYRDKCVTKEDVVNNILIILDNYKHFFKDFK